MSNHYELFKDQTVELINPEQEDFRLPLTAVVQEIFGNGLPVFLGIELPARPGRPVSKDLLVVPATAYRLAAPVYQAT